MSNLSVGIARFVFGATLVVFGLDGFVQFIPAPDMTPEAEAFMSALVETGYMVPFWKSAEVICGIAVLTGYFLPLALVVITPVLLNIVAFHLFLEPNPSALGLVAVMVACHITLTVRHWPVYREILKARPGADETEMSSPTPEISGGTS
jgi:hypothetical protein